jgi:hypothetical protein
MRSAVGQKLKPLEVAVGLVKGVLLQTKTADLVVGVLTLLGLLQRQELEFLGRDQMAGMV